MIKDYNHFLFKLLFVVFFTTTGFMAGNAATVTGGNGTITITDIAPGAQIDYNGPSTGWGLVQLCKGNCGTTQTISGLEPGDYSLKVQTFNPYSYNEYSGTVTAGGGGNDPCAAQGGDTDGDGICDNTDNCINTANADQADNDNDGIGNLCDPTPNGNGGGNTGILAVIGGNESIDITNIPAGATIDYNGPATGFALVSICNGGCGVTQTIPNLTEGTYSVKIQTFNPYTFQQFSIDVTAGSGGGGNDPCATQGGDTDGDGICDVQDNCINTSNADQADNDNDGIGNVCDPTPDGPVSTGVLAVTGGVESISITDIPAGAFIDYNGPATGFSLVSVCKGNCGTSQTIPNLAEGTYSVKIQTFNPYTYQQINVNVTSGVITVLPDVTITDVSVNENSGLATVQICLSTAATQAVTVQYVTASGTAVAGTDFTPRNGAVSFGIGQTCLPVEVTISDDQTDESNENFFVNLTNAINATITDAQGDITIIDNDDPIVINPFISIEDVLVDEGAGTAGVQICLSELSNQVVSVQYNTADGTADDDVDYIDVNQAIASIPVGQTCTTINIDIFDDQLDEPNETFFINLSNSIGGIILDPQSTVTIADNDEVIINPEISAQDINVAENAGILAAQVCLSEASNLNVSAQYATADGSASAGVEYAAASGILVFSAGETCKTINITIIDNQLDAPNKAFFINLSNPANGVILDAQSIVTIVDNDEIPCAVAGDTDGDGVCDDVDNCPTVANPDQADNDNDGIGNVCDDTPDGQPLRMANRTFDGKNNNLDNPEYGSVGQIYAREEGLPAQYGDGFNSLGGVNRPSPRKISNVLSDEKEDVRSRRQLSGTMYQWGQFIDHDFAQAITNIATPAPISLPFDESTFLSEISFSRSREREGTGIFGNPREQENLNTSWIDGSMVYGDNVEDATWLRSFQRGKLWVSSGNLLPYNTDTRQKSGTIDPNAPHMQDDTDSRTRLPKKTFVAGDLRAAENPGLTAMHTLFVREHNRLCDQFWAQGMRDDELIYQKARKVVGALLQHITYTQWMDALGIQVAPYTGYKPSVKPDLGNIFATAAYRWHTMVENDQIFRDNECRGVGPVELPLKELFFNIGIIERNGISTLLKGFTVHRAYETDVLVNSGLRNNLFGTRGIDLVSINLQRGRDHGLPDYNSIREYYTGSRVNSFEEITPDGAVAGRLRQLYGNVDNIDAWAGLFAEWHLPGKSVGMTVDAIFRSQFEKLRDGDYYYYMNDPGLNDMRSEILSTTLGDVIERNSSAGNFQPNVFIRKTCSDDPAEDLAKGRCDVINEYEGWTYLGQIGDKNYYRWNAGDLNHKDASDRASFIGGNLVQIAGRAENDAVRSLIGTSNFWLDLTLNPENKWAYSGQLIFGGGLIAGPVASYFNWNFGEPNNAGGEEDAVVMNADGRWNDIPSLATAPVIAEVTCSNSPILDGCFNVSYFDNTSLSGAPAVVQNESVIEHIHGTASPFPGILGTSDFSVRFQGNVVAPISGTYNFRAFVESGARLSVKNQLLFDDWGGGGDREIERTIFLNAGENVAIRFEYKDHSGNSFADLSWALPGDVTVTTETVKNTSILDPFGLFSGTRTITTETPNYSIIKVIGCPVPDPIPASFSDDECYTISARHSSKVLDVRGNGTSDGTVIQQFPFNGGSNQIWRIAAEDEGWSITSAASNKVLDVDGNISSDGRAIQLHRWQDISYQKWDITKIANNFHTIASIGSEKFITVQNGSTANSTPLIQSAATGGLNQQFIITLAHCPSSVQPLSTRQAPIHTMEARQKGDMAVINFVSNVKGAEYFTVEKENPVGKVFEEIAMISKEEAEANDLNKFISFDENPHDGDNFYRVVAHLTDGSTKVTEVRTVNFGILGQVAIYPNPASTELNVLLRNYKDQPATIFLHDTWGRTLRQIETDGANNSVNINTSDLISGNYLIRVTTKGKRDLTKSVIVTNEE